MLKDKKILLIISGGVAAYKTLELIRLIRKNNGYVQCILTNGGSQFVTPLSVSSLSGNKAYSELWSLNDESEMGHIRLSRESDLIIVAPASADIISKIAHGSADDLASTTLLASNKPILIAPGMNPEMWHNNATQSNIETLKQRGMIFTGPNTGEMACGETGLGRMSEPNEIFDAVTNFFFEKPLKGYSALVTSGPTYEPLDPVRFLGNRSSGKQGHAIAKALRDAGASVTLITGPTNQTSPQGMKIINIETSHELLKASTNALPVDIAVCAAAVSDWCVADPKTKKIKKTDNSNNMHDLQLEQTPDILKAISRHSKHRPELVIGFAAETNDLIENATVKLKKKGCDWIVANEVGIDANGVEKTFGSDENQIYLINQNEHEKWNRANKNVIAKKLVNKIINHMDN